MGLIALLYGLVSYVVFFVSFLYAIGFVGNLVVPRSIDSGEAGPPGTAIVINLLLLGVFAIQHNVMARKAFKRAWTKIVPESVERSTFVLISSLLLFVLYAYWQPMPATVWSVEGAAATALTALYFAGWLIVLLSSFMIDHFDLFGLRQVWLRFRGRPYTQLEFQTPFFYKHVRHPLLLGFIVAFWAAPTMSQGRLLFAAVTTVWIVISIVIEERDLVAAFGADYEDYQASVSMLIPGGPRKT